MAINYIAEANADIFNLLLSCPIIGADMDNGIFLFDVNGKPFMYNSCNRSNTARDLTRNAIAKAGIMDMERSKEVEATNLEYIRGNMPKESGMVSEVLNSVINRHKEAGQGINENVAVATAE